MDTGLSEAQRDCLQELINVAMGQASDKLARHLDTFVRLQVPNITLTSAANIVERFHRRYGERAVSMISQGYYGKEGIRGEALLVYVCENATNLYQMLGFAPESVSRDEVLTDLSCILSTTFLNAFAEQIHNQLSYSAPQLCSSEDEQIEEQLLRLSFNWDLALKVDIRYQVSDFAFDCDMILLIPDQALNNIQDVLERVLTEYA